MTGAVVDAWAGRGPDQMTAVDDGALHLVDGWAAREVAGHYLAEPGEGDAALVRAAYRQLAVQTDVLLALVVQRWIPRPLRIVTTRMALPYRTDEELIDSVRSTSVFELPASDRDRRNPLLGAERGGGHERFRALHDLLGHVIPGFGFDRDGEFSAWRLQHRMHHGLARWALATELHAQHSVRWTTGEFAEPRAVLLDRRVLRRSFAAGRRAMSAPLDRAGLGGMRAATLA